MGGEAMTEMFTTLRKIKSCGPCEEGWKKLLKHLGKTKCDDEPVPFRVIVESNGMDDALWCLRSTPEYARESRLFAVWCARQVKHLMKDQRSLDALDVAERFANGEATEEQREEACAAAKAAARDVARTAAGAESWDAARTADVANDAAGAAARTAAWDAAWDAARTAAGAAAGEAAWEAAWAAQKTEFLRMCAEGYPR
jgi:hypothetical protein